MRQSAKFYFLAILFNCIATLAFTQNPIMNVMRNALDTVSQRFLLPGITATIITNEGKVYHTAMGYADSVTKLPMQTNTRLLGGSTGKMYFSIAIMQLQELGKIDLDRKAIDYLGHLSWFKRVPNSEHFTVRHLLNHSAGVQEYYRLGNFFEKAMADPEKKWTHEELIGFTFDKEPLFTAGNGFSYADTHYLILELIIQKLTGKTAYEYIQQNIIQKAGLQVTIPSVSRVIPNLANGYSNPKLPSKVDGPMIRNGKLIVDPAFEGGGGGFATCSDDLAMLVHQLMQGKLVNSTSLTEMKKKNPATGQAGRNQFYALGLQGVVVNGDTAYGHSGWFPGYMSDVLHFSNGGFTIAVQYNTDMSPMGAIQPRDIILRIYRNLILPKN